MDVLNGSHWSVLNGARPGGAEESSMGAFIHFFISGESSGTHCSCNKSWWGREPLLRKLDWGGSRGIQSPQERVCLVRPPPRQPQRLPPSSLCPLCSPSPSQGTRQPSALSFTFLSQPNHPMVLSPHGHVLASSDQPSSGQGSEPLHWQLKTWVGSSASLDLSSGFSTCQILCWADCLS